MTPEQVRLVQESFALVKPIAPQAAAMFYDRLFAIAPDVKALFKDDMEEQGRKLMVALGFAVAGLTRLDQLAPVVRDLGRRHADYGVMDAHYGKVADALLWTLGQGLGDQFTPAVKDAWTMAYITLADVMKAAKTAA